MSRILRSVGFLGGAVVLAAAGVVGVSYADTTNDAPVTPATTFHGLPGNNPGHGGNSANPNGQGTNGGNGIHDIASNPGQSGVAPGDRDTPPSCDMHGGLGAANKNCN